MGSHRGGDGVADDLWRLAQSLRKALGDFDPSLLPPKECLAAVEKLAATEKACAALRVRLAARAVEHGAHRDQGFSTGVDWLAQQMGSTNGEARNALEAAKTLEECPETKAALVSGELSLAQAHAIGRSRPEMPDAEHDLVEVARKSGLGALRDAVRERRLRDADPARLHERQHRLREFRHWRDREGMVRFSGTLTPEVGLPIVNRLEADADRLRRERRAEGVDDPFCAHAADAMAAMLSGSGRGHATRSELVVVCDLGAYRRGHLHEGERCHLIGGGPIPVDLARAIGDDAFLKAVMIDGVKIHTVKHFGRHINAELRTALELGSPPDLRGVECVEAGCRRNYGLEWDHVDPVANGGSTSFDNLQPRCWPHHRDKTERDRRAGLLGRAPPT
jgi:Domain of unknown function (DUF222)/HNH endonuclease